MSPNDRPDTLAVLDSLNRVLAEWTNPRFVESMGAAVGLDMDASSITALTLVGRHGPLRPSAIAERMATGASNVSKILLRLEEAGLVGRERDRDDARATRVMLTDAGRKASVRLDKIGSHTLERLLASWSAQERVIFARLLGRFEEATVAMAATIEA